MILAIGSIFVSLLCVFGAVVLFQPEWLFNTLGEQSPHVLYSVQTEDKLVALTIDDGPDADHTSSILDLLKEYDAKATFFLIAGRVPGNEDLVRRMIEERHEIANHLMADEPSIRLEDAEFERQLIEAHALLSDFGQLRWFRPGSGWYNSQMIATAAEHGYQTVLGSVYPYDPQVGSAWFSARYVLWKVRPGSIVVLHDGGRRGERTLKALATILPELRQRGFKMVTLSDLYDHDQPQ
jgi:peptidoglycan/xylan/chitin deacetylase (PgdA/CDA1 family)